MLCTMENLMFQLLSVGQYTHTPGYYLIKGRPFAALSLRLTGEARITVAGETFRSLPGDVLFLPESVDYAAEYTAGESIAAHLLACNATRPENLSTPEKTQLQALYSMLFSLWKEGSKPNGCKAMLYQILQVLAEAEEPTGPAAQTVHCAALMRERAGDAALSIAVLGAEAGFSPSGLRRAFHRCYGISPKQYLTRLRMEKAIRLLSAGGRSVRMVAQECGFADEKYFSRAMKKYCGVPPTVLLPKRIAPSAEGRR